MRTVGTITGERKKKHCVAIRATQEMVDAIQVQFNILMSA